MALYIRTHNADRMSHKERHAQAEEGESTYRDRAMDILDCALQLEKQQDNATRTVWLVVTDSPKLKQWISKEYSSNRRDIVTTPSRGVHSRPSQTPSIQDIGEALVDWYLLGESDIVITDKESPTFGGTAALRTARPLYSADKCTQQPLIHDEARRGDFKVKKHPPRQY